MEKLEENEIQLVKEIIEKHNSDLLPEFDIIVNGEKLELNKCHDIRCAIADEFAEKGMDSEGLNEYGLKLKSLLDKIMLFAIKEDS